MNGENTKLSCALSRIVASCASVGPAATTIPALAEIALSTQSGAAAPAAADAIYSVTLARP